MKVVLLLDSSLTSCEKVHDSFNDALLVALRLLSFLRNRTGDQGNDEASPSPKSKRNKSRNTNTTFKHEDRLSIKPCFQWGFKFFSSAGSVMRSKLSKKASTFMNTWNQDSFSNFQNNLETVFQSEKVTTNKRSSLTHPSERLTTALTEILHDFEWKDKNDLLKSPGRSLRKRISSHSDKVKTKKDKNNLVFIFANAPSSRQCLRRFSNKLVIDSDVFVDSFMSPALLEEYNDKSQINVYWVDFNNPLDDTIDLDTRQESLAIVAESFKKLGGNLLYKHDILKCFPSNTRIPNFTEIHPPISSLSTETCLVQTLSLSKDDGPSQHLKDIDSSIYVKGSSKLELSGAKLMSFINKQSQSMDESCSETSTSLCNKEASEANDDLRLTDVDIELQGCVSSSAVAEFVTNLQMQQSTVLTCGQESKISLLLGTLIKAQCHGILKIYPKEEDVHFQMAVLAALTSTCGHVFLISWNQQLSLEKAYIFDRTTSCDKDQSPAKPFNSHVLNSWHKPGSTKQLGPLIGDFKNRSSFQTVSCSAKDIMAKVRALYLKTKEKQQQQEKPVPVTSTPVSGKDTSILSKIGGSAESESASGSSQVQIRRLSRKSSSSLSRGRLLVERARSTSILMAGEEEGSNLSRSVAASPAGRRTSGSAGFESLNIQSENELLDYLTKQYSQVVAAGVAMEASIQAMLTVTCYFMSTKEMATNPQKSAITFIRKHLAQDPAKLKEKYGKSDDVDKKSQAVEYKLQVMLLLEMASFVPDNEDFQGERLLNALVSMLRVLSFIIGPASVREFMANATDSHCGTLPRVLMDVYDELDLPYPAILAKLTSPSAPSTVWGQNMSVGSVDSFHSGPYSSQPPSSGQLLSQGAKRTSLKQHPSLTDFRQKKQILVEKPKSRPVAKTEGKRSAKDKNKSKGKSSKTKSGGDYDRAKRNLFSDKSKVKKAKDRLQLTPKGKSGKPKLLVPGTPAHKQISGRILSRQQRLRDHLNIKPDVQVVEESPVKDDEPRGSVTNKPARFLLREAFYSSNSCQSRIVAKSMEMEEKGGRPATSPHRFLHSSRSHGSLISAVRGESPILSPRSRMIKSFMASPTPERKSHKKKITTPTSSTSTPPSHLPRRSPRKSVKKLLFHPTPVTTSTTSTISNVSQDLAKDNGRNKQNSLDAKLVFDGENASDALPTMSSFKNPETFEMPGLKTPEKRNESPRFGSWSCSPLQVTPTKSQPVKQVRTPELSFKNAFNCPSTSNRSPECTFSRNSPRKSSKSVHGSPSQWDHGDDLYQKSGKVRVKPKAGFRKSASDSAKFHRVDKDFVNLQKRVSPQKAVKKDLSQTKRGSSSFTRCPDTRRNSFHHVNISNATSHFEGIDKEDPEVVLSTPKKMKYNSNPSSFHTTPSKVTFSDSFLISPPTGSGRPVSLTPSKSILKGLPSTKAQSYVRKIELADCEFKKLPNESFISPNSKKLSVADSPSKMLRISSFKERTSNSFLQESSHQNKSPLKHNDPKIISSAKRFDEDSSSNESTNLDTDRVPSASTVVTAHTPSPSNKCKTPDSIKNWIRKKRNSGSRTVSSSSSSSVSPVSSNEFKEKPLDEVGNESSKRSVSGEDVKEKEINILAGKNLKRNLFSSDAATSSDLNYPLSKKRKNSSDNVGKISSSKTIEENDIVEKATNDKDKSKKLFSHASGGFSHSIHSLEESNLSIDRLTSEGGMPSLPIASTSTVAQIASHSCFSPSRSPSKRHRLPQQDSSFMGEGSQGFLVDSENLNSSDAPSTSGSKEEKVPDPTTCAKLSVDVNQSPSNSKSTPAKRPQYSPALSTSGLLQLIRSPLLDDTKKKNAERRRTRSSKSRKHLDLPM